jgi:thioredoxin 1
MPFIPRDARREAFWFSKRDRGKRLSNNMNEEKKMADESSLIHVTDKNFAEEVLNADLPVLVDFWATWCAPCRSISPIVEDLANEFTGKVKVTKCNVDENPGTPSQYGVRGIPTLILFKEGKIFDQIVGAVPKARLKSMIEKAL